MAKMFTLEEANLLLGLLHHPNLAFFDKRTSGIFRTSSFASEEQREAFQQFVHKKILPVLKDKKSAIEEKINSITALIPRDAQSTEPLYSTHHFCDLIKSLCTTTKFKHSDGLKHYTKQNGKNIDEFVQSPALSKVLEQFRFSGEAGAGSEQNLANLLKTQALRTVFQNIIDYAEQHNDKAFAQFIYLQISLLHTVVTSVQAPSHDRLDFYGCGFFLARPFGHLLNIDFSTPELSDPDKCTKDKFDQERVVLNARVKQIKYIEKVLQFIIKWHLETLDCPPKKLSGDIKSKSDSHLDSRTLSQLPSLGRFSLRSRTQDNIEPRTVNNVLYGKNLSSLNKVKSAPEEIQDLSSRVRSLSIDEKKDPDHTKSIPTLRKCNAVIFSEEAKQKGITRLARSKSDENICYSPSGSPAPSPTKGDNSAPKV